MNKDEMLEVREYHFKKIKNLFEIYIYREIDYKNNNFSDTRLLKLEQFIKELKSEKERINEINTMLYNYDNKE